MSRKSHCSFCGRELTAKWYADREQKRRISIQTAFAGRKALGLNVGRPRILDYRKIYELRDKGYSMRKIARTLKCTHPIISRALRERDL